MDEYFDLLTKYKAAYPTIDGAPTIGFQVMHTDWRVWPLLNAPMFLQGYGNWGDFAVGDIVNHVAIPKFDQPWFRPYIEKLNQEYLNGLVDAESMTLDHDGILAQIASGTVLGFFDQEWSFQSGRDRLITEGKENRAYTPLALTYDSSIKPWYLEAAGFSPNNGIGITVSCANPERAIAYMEYVAGETVQVWLKWGNAGEHYNIENGRFIRPESQRELQRDAQWGRDNMGGWLAGMLPGINGTYDNGNASTPGTQPEEYLAGLSDYNKALYTKLGINTRIDFLGDQVKPPTYFPFWSMAWNGSGSVGDQAKVRLVDDVCKIQLPRLVTAPAGQFDAMYADFQAAVKAIDLTEMYKEIDAEIQERIAAAGAVF
jgi:putative aldouronate transport system substrate-binding protein